MHERLKAAVGTPVRARNTFPSTSYKQSANRMGVTNMGVKYFFDVPVYRLARDKYYRERDAYIDDVLFPKDLRYVDELRARDKADPRLNAAIRDHLERSYGGSWDFNEIIGYIRLHFLGSQVRGEYFGVSRKRIVRTRTRTVEHQTWKLAPEVDIPQPLTSHGILNAIRGYIENCKKQLPNRYVEASMFEAIAGSIDWPALFHSP